jgi:hypothetical protein
VDELKMAQTSWGVLFEGPATQLIERPGGNAAATGVCRRPIANFTHRLPSTLVKLEYDMSGWVAGLNTMGIGLMYRITDPVSGLAALMLRGDPLPDLLAVPSGKAGPPT